MEQIALSWEPQRRLFTVGELNRELRGVFEEQYAGIFVSGEISGCRMASSGHSYFTLKDQDAQLKCVWFRGAMRFSKFKPQDGMAVLARGSLDLYEPRGEYQLVVESLEPRGLGALQVAFDQLKKRLAAEGLFAAERKRPLPRLPRRIGIVTSPAGAVIQDLLQVMSRRFPGLHVQIYPAQVQGEGSIEAVCRGLAHFGASGWAEVIIVARGGGSLEDLWTFNEEAVARAIAACAVPVISAIGHETDFTIADFVADLRAPTPSAAAEMVICTRDQLLGQIEGLRAGMVQRTRYGLAMLTRQLHRQGMERGRAALERRIGRGLQRVDELDYCLRDKMRGHLQTGKRRTTDLDQRLRALDLRLRFAEARRRLQSGEEELQRCMRARLTRAHRAFEPAAAHLSQLSPLKILDRGYALVTTETGSVVKAPADAPAGSRIHVRLAVDALDAQVI